MIRRRLFLLGGASSVALISHPRLADAQGSRVSILEKALIYIGYAVNTVQLGEILTGVLERGGECQVNLGLVEDFRRKLQFMSGGIDWFASRRPLVASSDLEGSVFVTEVFFMNDVLRELSRFGEPGSPSNRALIMWAVFKNRLDELIASARAVRDSASIILSNIGNNIELRMAIARVDQTDVHQILSKANTLALAIPGSDREFIEVRNTTEGIAGIAPKLADVFANLERQVRQQRSRVACWRL